MGKLTARVDRGDGTVDRKLVRRLLVELRARALEPETGEQP